MNEELIDLQTKLAFQEDLLEQLNQVVTEQQDQISRLELAIETLKIQLQAVQASIPDSGQQQYEIPPHY